MLSTSSGAVQIFNRGDTLSLIHAGDEGSFKFKLSLTDSAQEPYIANFTLTLVSREKYIKSQSFRLTCLAGFFDNFEIGENGWWHQVRMNPGNSHDDWQWGIPQGAAGGQDPSNAYSGNYCWGNDLGGEGWNGYCQHDVNIFLHSPVIYCSRYSDLGLTFMRWLNIRPGDVATVHVNDQVAWTSRSLPIYDNHWTEQYIDISSKADGDSSVVISFGLTSNNSDAAGGWSIDDVTIKDQLAASIPKLIERKIPQKYQMFQNYPNPFNPSTTIRYQLFAQGNVDISIYNLLGQKVRQLVNKKLQAGSFTVTWDGKDFSGNEVSSGIYLVNFEAKSKDTGLVHKQVKKMILVR